MKIHNVRLGFATNSSSTHSIVLNPSFSADWNASQEAEYGWEDFLLRSRENKARYLAAQIACNLANAGMSHRYAAHIVNGMLGTQVMNDAWEWGIDHQSVITLPLQHPAKNGPWSRGRNEVDLDFAREFYDHVYNNDDLAIAGGNDNQCDYEKVNYGGTVDKATAPLPRDYGNKDFICRQDGPYWVIFNRSNGSKIRLSFQTDRPYEAATTPELVDIKITDMCPYGCKFCYQNSTIKGQHAGMEAMEHIIRVLSGMQVFEVALGGGETTMHPNFADILRQCYNYGLIPNFTTFNMNWTKNPEIEQAVLEYCGGFAVSITGNDYNDYATPKMQEMRDWLNRHPNFKGRVAVQMILGLADTQQVVKTLEDLHENNLNQITFLGYKSFGRGIEVAKKQKIHHVDMKAVIAAAKKYWINVGLDTKAVNNYKGVLDEEGISEILRTTKEGAFSMYVDAVASKVGKDSYTDAMIPFTASYHGEDKLEDVVSKNFPFAETALMDPYQHDEEEDKVHS